MPESPFQRFSHNKKNQHIIDKMVDPKMHKHRGKETVILPSFQNSRCKHCTFCIHKIRILRRTGNFQI